MYTSQRDTGAPLLAIRLVIERIDPKKLEFRQESPAGTETS